jgi:hypothetical protein
MRTLMTDVTAFDGGPRIAPNNGYAGNALRTPCRRDASVTKSEAANRIPTVCLVRIPIDRCQPCRCAADSRRLFWFLHASVTLLAADRFEPYARRPDYRLPKYSGLQTPVLDYMPLA